MTIGTKIKQLRDKKNISQRDLAIKLGIGQTTLVGIESGSTDKIDFLLMDKICKEFEVGFDYFIEDKQVNNVEKNDGSIGVVGPNHGTINLFPENIIEQIKLLVEDNKQKEIEIKALKQSIKDLKK